MEEESIQIIVAAHKPYPMPKDTIYLPLHVGAEGKKDKWGNALDIGFAKDNTGEHISGKNASYCELTGLYWAWKNLDSAYVGMAHYRRHFCYKRKNKNVFSNIFTTKKKNRNSFEDILTADEAGKLVSSYKVIVPEKRRYYIETLYSHYAHTHYAGHLDKCREIIQEKYPRYMGAFDRVMRHTYGYMFNMMIMKKELLDAYCTWLFAILSALEEADITPGLSFYQGRFYGRVSELLFNVWLTYQIDNGMIGKADIKEIGCIYTEKIDWKRKIASFLKAKFIHRRYEGSF